MVVTRPESAELVRVSRIRTTIVRGTFHRGAYEATIVSELRAGAGSLFRTPESSTNYRLDSRTQHYAPEGHDADRGIHSSVVAFARLFLYVEQFDSASNPNANSHAYSYPGATPVSSYADFRLDQ